MLREVARRRHHGHPHLRADLHGDHVVGDLLAHPDPGVKSLGDDVGQAVIDDDLDLYVGMLGKETSKGGLQD